MNEQGLRVSAVSGGQSVELNDLCGYILEEVEGLGVTEVARLTQRGPLQDGDSDVGYRRSARLIMLAWALQEGSPARLYDLRAELVGVLRPRVADPVQLVFSLPNAARVAADVYLQGDLNFATRERSDGLTQRVAVVLRAADPRLYDPKQKTVSFTLLDSVGGWDAEEDLAVSANGWSIEETGQSTADGWNIGQSSLNKIQSILYANGARHADVEYPLIRVVGPIVSPVIENLTTGEKLELTANGGLSLGIGQFVEIDLNYGAGKTVKDQDGNAVDQFLSDESDLATFHLSYAGELLADGARSTGENQMRVTGDGASLVTRVDIIYHDRYAGV